jgi:hypothetical protein
MTAPAETDSHTTVDNGTVDAVDNTVHEAVHPAVHEVAEPGTSVTPAVTFGVTPGEAASVGQPEAPVVPAGATRHPISADDGQGTDAPAVGDAAGDARESARDAWRRSVAMGEPLTGRELAKRFGRSERWGRDRVAEARRADGNGNGAPSRRRRARGTATPDLAADRAAGTANGGTNRQDTVVPVPPETAPVAEAVPAREPARQPDGMPAAPDEVPRGTDAAVLPAGARLVAWAGFLFGTVISVAANVLYAWLPSLTEGAAAPGLAPQVGAAVWPIALVISVEVLSRVPWRPGWAWQLARYGGAGVVAIGAAVISYGHLRGVLAAWGYGTTGAAVGPLVVDGLMTISGFALLAMGDHGKNGREANR